MFKKNNKESKRKAKVSLGDNTTKFVKDFEDIVKTGDITTVNKILKFMASSVQSELLSKCLYNDRNYGDFKDYIIHSFLLDLPLEYRKEEVTEIEIEKTPIISCVWNHEKMKDNLKQIGKSTGNPFDGEAHSGNILGILIKPIELVIIYNGNHSVNSAIVHNEGKLFVGEVVDISPNLTKYIFDGENYINTNTKEKIKCDSLLEGSKPFNYTLGLLFEMTRILKNKYRNE